MFKKMGPRSWESQRKDVCFFLSAVAAICIAISLSSCAGSQGLTGEQGMNGSQGLEGITGSSGSNGLQGVEGVTGTNGISGPTGQNGRNGHSAVFKQEVADKSLCKHGGTVLSVGVDLNDDGVLESNEVTNVVIVCNGN